MLWVTGVTGLLWEGSFYRPRLLTASNIPPTLTGPSGCKTCCPSHKGGHLV